MSIGRVLEMNLPITGGCYCGAVRYESTAEPLMMVRCHCRDCQKVSGGPYVPAVAFPLKAFRITQGSIRRFGTTSDHGGHNIRGFCPECGSRLTGAENADRGVVAVVASSLDDPGIFVPKLDMYVADAQPWDLLDDKIPKFPGSMPSR